MYNNNNYLKCPICKVVFSQKYIRNHYRSCLEKYNKIIEIKNNIIKRKKINEERTNRIRINEKNNSKKEKKLTLYRNNLYKIYNTTNINDKYTYYYKKYLSGKNVALVGPASSIIRTNSGRIIDNFDLIVRLNKSLPLSRKLIVDIGSRTDILYNSLNRYDYPGENILDENFFINNGLKFLCTSYPNLSPFNSDIKYYLDNSNCKLPFRIIDKDLYYKIKNTLHTRPNTGIMAIIDLLNTNLKRLYITGLNFYKTNYYKNYQKNSNQIVQYSNNNIHNQSSQIKLLKYLVLTDNRIIIDKVLHKILFNDYINFFRKKKEIDNNNIFKLKSDHINILLNEYKNPIFVGSKEKHINISNNDVIICMDPFYVKANSNIPIISLKESKDIVAIINLKNSIIDNDIIEYKCNKRYYKELTNCLRYLNIYKFSIEFFIFMCLIHYYPNLETISTNFDERNGENMLYKYYKIFMNKL